MRYTYRLIKTTRRGKRHLLFFCVFSQHSEAFIRARVCVRVRARAPLYHSDGEAYYTATSRIQRSTCFPVDIFRRSLHGPRA